MQVALIFFLSQDSQAEIQRNFKVVYVSRHSGLSRTPFLYNVILEFSGAPSYQPLSALSS